MAEIQREAVGDLLPVRSGSALTAAAEADDVSVRRETCIDFDVGVARAGQLRRGP
jgi:hypothetical protein